MVGTIIIIGLFVVGIAFALGHHFGRSEEQKALAATLMEFSRVDADAKGLVNRCYRHVSGGLKTELKRLGL
jgi:hypothetical protein